MCEFGFVWEVCVFVCMCMCVWEGCVYVCMGGLCVCAGGCVCVCVCTREGKFVLGWYSCFQNVS